MNLPTHAFLIDHHAGRQTEIAGGKTIEEQYSTALKRHGVSSVATGHGFIWGADDPEAGIEALRSWLHVREDATTKMRVFSEKLPNFEWKIRRYHVSAHHAQGGSWAWGRRSTEAG